MSRIVFAGVDVETTGLTERHKVIQIGVSLNSVDLFVRDVGYPTAGLEISAEALQVNGFTLDRIMEASGPATVDAVLLSWLGTRVEPEAVIVPVGWNVGSFDMPFVRRTFPHSAKFFHPYRSLDLNSLCYAIGDIGGGYEVVKNAANAWARVQAGPGKEHDAGYDARTSILALRYLQGYGIRLRESDYRLEDALLVSGRLEIAS